MPTDTPDQQITMPVDADSADNPVAFNQAVGDIEPKLVREYTTEADRTARMLVLGANDVSSLSAPTVGTARLETYDGANHVSLVTRSLYAMVRKAADETVSNTTTLQNDDTLLCALPASGTFVFELDLLYSATTVADLKYAFNAAAGASLTVWGIGLAVGATTLDGNLRANFAQGLANDRSLGGIGATTVVPAVIRGEIVPGGTAGNLTFQWAQQNLEVSNCIVRASSRLQVWRVA